MSAPLLRPLGLSQGLSQCACRPQSRLLRCPSFEQTRCISGSPCLLSGHSKWATIKHDKSRNDAAKSKQRSILSRDISKAVKLAGPDPNMNPRLSLAISTAKKSAVPKAAIDAAIARGQGLSATGATLESLVLEAILPPSIAIVIECQTDSKLHTLTNLRNIVKEAGGNVSPVGYMFEKKGRILLARKEGLGADEVLEEALEMGVLDVVEDEQGKVALLTEPSQTKNTAEALAKHLDVEVEESEIIYDPNEDTQVALDDELAAKDINKFLDELQEVQGLQGVYMNCTKGPMVPEELWADLQSKVTV